MQTKLKKNAFKRRRKNQSTESTDRPANLKYAAMMNVQLDWFIQDRKKKLSKSVTESVPGSPVHSSHKVQSGLIQIQFNLLTLADILDDILLKTKTWS